MLDMCVPRSPLLSKDIFDIEMPINAMYYTVQYSIYHKLIT